MNKFPKYVKKHGDIRNQLNAIGRIHRYLGFKSSSIVSYMLILIIVP